MTLANILRARREIATAVGAGIGHPEQLSHSPCEHWTNISSNIARRFPSDVGSLAAFLETLNVNTEPVDSYTMNGYMRRIQADSKVPVEFRFSDHLLGFLVPSRSVFSCNSAHDIESGQGSVIYAGECNLLKLSSSIGVIINAELINCSKSVGVGYDSIQHPALGFADPSVKVNTSVISSRNTNGSFRVERCNDSVVFVEANRAHLCEQSLSDSILLVKSPFVQMDREPEIKYVVPPPGYRPKTKGWGEVICLDDFVLKDGIRPEKKLPAGRYNFPYWSRMGDVPDCVKDVGYFSVKGPLSDMPIEYCVLPDGGIAVFGYVDNGRIVPVRDVHNADATRVLADFVSGQFGSIPLIYDDVVLPRRVISPSPVDELRARINAELAAKNTSQTPNS